MAADLKTQTTDQLEVLYRMVIFLASNIRELQPSDKAHLFNDYMNGLIKKYEEVRANARI